MSAFKHNNSNPEETGQHLSALSNGAALHGKLLGYMIWGVEGVSRAGIGTTFRPKVEKCPLLPVLGDSRGNVQ